MSYKEEDWRQQSGDDNNNWWWLLCMCTVFSVMLWLMSSCKVCKPTVIVKDSIRIEQRLDSVYLYEKDSFYIDRWRSGDTVYLTNERWSIRYKDKLVEVHDTINNTTTETIVEKERYVPSFYKWSAWVCWIGIALLVLWIAWKLVKKFYLHK